MKKLLLLFAALLVAGCDNNEAKTAYEDTSDGSNPSALGNDIAREWLKKAKKGDRVSQYFIGSCYYDGTMGMREDEEEAFKWFRKAANQGDASAQYALGWGYSFGGNFPEDLVAAHAWFKISMANGSIWDREIDRWLPDILEKLTPEQIAQAEKLYTEMIDNNPNLLDDKGEEVETLEESQN